jgi:hypothetical protein
MVGQDNPSVNGKGPFGFGAPDRRAQSCDFAGEQL